MNILNSNSNNNNINKFNFNTNFHIQPVNGYLLNYPQTPQIQNGVRAFNLPNSNLPNTFLPNPSNNNFIPIDIKHGTNNLAFNNGNINCLGSNNRKTSLTDNITKTNNNNGNNREEQLDFKINLENIILGKDKRTTIMLRNIPNKYSLANLVEEINNLYLGKIDYINLPIDYEVK